MGKEPHGAATTFIIGFIGGFIVGILAVWAFFGGV
jgi:hypothetical protein